MTQGMKTYEVSVEREGRWWVFQIPELGPGAAGQAKSLAEVESEALDVAAMWLDVDPQILAVDVKVQGIDHWVEEWKRVAAEDEAARAAQAAAAEKRRLIVKTMREQQRWSAVDAAAVLGVTKQRIYQLER